MNNLYGPEYILKERASGYKSTSYAIAEIVDNSVDANSRNIEIYLVDEIIRSHRNTRTRISKILIVDDGEGMADDMLNRCLTFSDGAGTSNHRIGTFGVGLPKSSISVARRVDVFSRKENGPWKAVYLSLDELVSSGDIKYKPSVERKPSFDFPVELNVSKTVVEWSELDRVDYKKSETLARHLHKVFGRIYRYQIREGLNISIKVLVEGDSTYEVSTSSVLLYDPMFTTPGNTFETKTIWDAVLAPDPFGREKGLENNPLYDSRNFYSKFTEGYESYEGNSPLFQEFDDFWDLTYEIELNGRKYAWKLFASLAYKDITNPGIRSGGKTKVGRLIGEKMTGSREFKSGNIYFIRAGREIDFGHFGLYTVTDEKNRFWTIEIHFESDLDELIGLSNNKQSVQFTGTTVGDNVESAYVGENLSFGEMRHTLWAQITKKVSKAIKEMRKVHSRYAREWKDQYAIDIRDSGGEGGKKIPTLEPAVIEVLPPGGRIWTQDEIEEVTRFLKSRYDHLLEDEIRRQVSAFSEGKLKTIVLYGPTSTGYLFEYTEKRGKKITIINTKHPFYENVIEPLKYHRAFGIFTISIEILISSLSVTYDFLTEDNPDKYLAPLDKYFEYLSSRLDEFISDSHLKINVNHFLEKMEEEAEDNREV